MESNKMIRSFFRSLLLLMLTACNMPMPATPTSNLEAIVASTRTAIAVSQFLTATSLPYPIPETSTLVPVQQTPNPTASLAPIQLTAVTPPSAVPSLPASPQAHQPGCTYTAKFEGETIPDGTSISGSQGFLKTWTLRNTGTCTWPPETSLFFVRGDQLSGQSPAPIGQSVSPNNTIQISVDLQAPASAGQFQGYWKLRSPEGVEFGLGPNGDVAFWVKVQVVQGSGSATTNAPIVGPQNLGKPDRTVNFDSEKSPFYLGTDEGIDYDIKNGRLVVTASKPIGDRWRVASLGYLDDFFVQANFKVGPACSAKDGYGLLLRAPDKASGVINSGYVFSFSCDGKFRVYRMDNGVYDGIQNWTSSPALLSGSSQTNMMGVSLHQDELQLFANGTLIYQFSDDTYEGGLLGLMIRSEATTEFQISIEEILIWNIP